MTHAIPYTKAEPPPDSRWDAEPWRNVEPVEVGHFHPLSTDHRPRVQAKLLHSGRALHLLFRVQDRFVRATCTEHGQKVCRDSCVEAFFQPRPDGGYFNVEVNCGGTLLVWYVEDPTMVGDTLKRFVDVSSEAASAIRVYHSLPRQIPDEIDRPTEWSLQLTIPVQFLERHAGPLGELGGQAWGGNLFKCADGTSHPHWASWNPIGDELNFHQPGHFGRLIFAAREVK